MRLLALQLKLSLVVSWMCLLQLSMSEPIGPRSSSSQQVKSFVNIRRVARNDPTLSQYLATQTRVGLLPEVMTTESSALDTSDGFRVFEQSANPAEEDINSFIAAAPLDEVGEQPAAAIEQLPFFEEQPTGQPTVFESPIGESPVVPTVILPVTEGSPLLLQAEDPASFNLDLKFAEEPILSSVLPDVSLKTGQAPVVEFPLEDGANPEVAESPIVVHTFQEVSLAEPIPEPLPEPHEPAVLSSPDSIQVVEIISPPADAPLELEPVRLEEVVAAAPIIPLELPAPIRVKEHDSKKANYMIQHSSNQGKSRPAPSAYGFAPIAPSSHEQSHISSQQETSNFAKRPFGSPPTPRALGFPPIANTRDNLFHDVNWSKLGRPYRSIKAKTA